MVLYLSVKSDKLTVSTASTEFLQSQLLGLN